MLRIQADVAGPLPQVTGDPRGDDALHFWARGFRQAREPHAELLWEARALEAGAPSSSSAAAASARPTVTLIPGPGVNPATIPPPEPQSRLQRISERLVTDRDDVEDLSD